MPTTRERGGVAVSTSTGTTSRARARAPATVARPTRSRKEPVQQDDELADELERVLKISQPKVPVKRTFTKAPSGSATKPGPKQVALDVKPARTVKKAVSAAESDHGTKVEGAGKTARPGPAVHTAKATSATAGSSQAVQPTADRRKVQVSAQLEAGPSKRPAIPPKHTSSSRPDSQRKPNAIASSSRLKPVQRNPPAYTTDPSLTPIERAKIANTALNTSQAALGISTLR